MAHGIVRTDALEATNRRGRCPSFKYEPSSTPTAIDNGNFVALGALKTGERELCTAATPAANTPLTNLVLVASEEVDKTENKVGLADFYNKAGDICRGYRLVTGDFFSITADAFEFDSGVTGTVGTTILEAQAKIKALAVDSATVGSTKIATLYAIEQDGPITYYVWQVA